ncbi:MAG: 2-hydroxyacid dehydrogenase [Bacteroidota bacterium]|nr:2-hydroxyacid dehydrogenase [Bacteroidota bacterium]
MKILHLDSNHRILAEMLNRQEFVNDFDFTSTKTEVEDKLPQYQGVVIRSRFTIDRQFIDRGTNLKFIARVGAGVENIDVDYAKSKGIRLIAAPEGNRNAVGEHALGMLLSLFNKLNLADQSVRLGKWEREQHRGYELEGKTIGIIGYGNMGKSFAKKLSGFDVAEVLFYDIQSGLADQYAREVSLEELQQKSDVISLHTPYTPLTHNMINQDFIQKLSKPIWLLNTARGKNVSTSALVSALQKGQILGAGLDVLEYEKTSFEAIDNIPDDLNYLFTSPKVILSPHIAGWTFESHVKLAQTIGNKILDFLEELKNQSE